MLKHKPINILPLILLVSAFQALTLSAQQSTASPHIKVLELFSPQLQAKRTIRLYLPYNYTSGTKRYPVIYMHDAQNLFDKSTSYSGEWRVDEALDSLKAEVIVVGIDHGGDKRISELTPYPNPKYGGGHADEYLDFVVNTLKPHIDSLYRTKPEKAETAIMGSSLGGLTSYYAALKYPDVFGKAAVFSPAFWYTDDIFQLTEKQKKITARLYFMAGDSEDAEMVPDLERMEALLKTRMKNSNRFRKIVQGGKHNEALWASEFVQAYLWLMKK